MSVLAGACGARTGLFTAQAEDEKDAAAADGALPDAGSGEGDAEGEGGAGGYCSLYEGPVASCDAGAAAGPVQRCAPPTPVCTQMASPGWGCCDTRHMQACSWSQFLPDASCM
jgi:hypothetical protein